MEDMVQAASKQLKEGKRSPKNRNQFTKNRRGSLSVCAPVASASRYLRLRYEHANLTHL